MKKKVQKNSYIKGAIPSTFKNQQKKKAFQNLSDPYKVSSRQKSAEKKIINLSMFDRTKSRLKNTLKSTRYKTEIDDYSSKPNFNINNSFYDEKNEKQRKSLFNDEKKINEHNRYISDHERKNKTVRRLNLNLQIFKNLRNKSIQKKRSNFKGKNEEPIPFKPQISHRIGNKKTIPPDRVYGSLQNLRKQRQMRQMSRNSNYQLRGENKNKNSVQQKRAKQKNIILILQEESLAKSSNQKQKTALNQKINKQIQKKNQKKLKRESRLQRNQIYRKIFQQKDESLQKFQIKFQKSNKYDLSRQEIEIFGDRFPEGFQKIKLLGRGGFSLVWLGQHSKNKKQFAVKQIITQSDHQTHLKQIWFGTLFFQFGGVPKAEFAAHPGIKNLAKLYYYFINRKDTWLMYQNCGQSLGNSLYDLKKQRVNGERLYRIVYKPLYEKIRKNQNEIRKIILQTAKVLDLLALSNIVHSDLKTENILIKQNNNSDDQVIKQVKLVDYGSAFVFNNIRQFSMATPQYMAPQVLNFILHENELEYIQKLLDYIQNYNNSWVIDVWSLGCVLLQIVSGIPLWMSLKTLINKPDDNKEVIKQGLFAVEGRHFDLIIRKQIQVIQNIDIYLNQQNYSGINLETDLRALLKRMLALNPKKRVSPSQIIQFLEQSLQSQQSFTYQQGSQKQQIKNK